MKLKFYSILYIFILLIIGGSECITKKVLAENSLSGNVSISLKNGVWKLLEEKPIYQDIMIDLECEKNQCKKEVYGWAPKYNQEVDHQGETEVTYKNNAWQAKVTMNIRSSPFTMKTEKAEYNIEFVSYKNNELIGSYTGKFNGQFLQGKVRGIIRQNIVNYIPDHQPIKSQEHPRLVFRTSEIETLRKKAKTEYGKAILTQLNKSLQSKIYYDGFSPNGGYHAAGYCFLALLNNDKQAASKGWQITQQTIANSAPRVLEQSQIVTGIALAYDLCYPIWDQRKRQDLTKWLANQAVKLTSGGGEGWNNATVSNWNVRSRSAGGLALLAIMNEPAEFFPNNEFWQSPDNLQLFLQTDKRNIERYIDLALGDAGFGTEGDLYTYVSANLMIPFLHAYREVLGQDLISDSKVAMLSSNAVMRMVKQNGDVYIPAYGRHRVGAKGSLFAHNLANLPEQFLPAILWFFDDYFGLKGDRTFGVGEYTPHDAIYALVGYNDEIERKNPAEFFGKILVDQQKGLFVFRNQWQNKDDFVSSIYLKLEPRVGGWSFPEVGSFRITGLGTNWAIASISDGKPESENIVNLPKATPFETAKPISFFEKQDGSGIITMTMKDIVIPNTDPPLQINNLRSFAVDYSGVSGAPALFAIIDQFSGANSNEYFQEKNWIMHTEGEVKIEGNKFIISDNLGGTLNGVFVTPKNVKISAEKNEQITKIIATGGDEFFVVMTIQKGQAPPIKIQGNPSLDARVDVGKQTIRFINNRLVLDHF